MTLNPDTPLITCPQCRAAPPLTSPPCGDIKGISGETLPELHELDLAALGTEPKSQARHQEGESNAEVG